MEDVENTSKPEEMELSGKSYFQDVSLEEAENNIHACLRDAARNVIATGHYLKVIRDKELYREAGYENIWDYAAERFGFSKSTASRYMTRNDKFSVGGNSPILAEEFREYSKAQLQEMLSLDAEQMSAVTPDMTVREIRELRKPKELPYYEIPGQLDISDFPGMEDATETENGSAAEKPIQTETVASTMAFMVSAEDLIGEPEEKLSAYGFPKRVYPADSLLTTPGCKGDDGQGYDCFGCHLECDIRQEYCRCVAATCGFPFPCQMVDTGKHEILEKKIGERCQFIDLNLADHAAGDGSPIPCCKNCETPCEYACENSGKRVATSQQSVAAEKQQDIPEKPKTEKCIHDGISRCTLSEEDKEKDGTGEDCAHHCCWKCEKRGDCKLECDASTKRTSRSILEPTDVDETDEMIDPPEEYNREILARLIENAEAAMNEMEKCWKNDSPKIYTKKRMEIDAFKMYLEKMDQAEAEQNAEEVKQPELPMLKNDKQRAEFIDAYEEWPLWIDTQKTGERYYRYDLPDGTSFVIKTYHAMLYDYSQSGCHYKEGYGENEQYLLQPGKFFRDCRTNRSTLIDKLKELQKAGS